MDFLDDNANNNNNNSNNNNDENESIIESVSSLLLTTVANLNAHDDDDDDDDDDDAKRERIDEILNHNLPNDDDNGQLVENEIIEFKQQQEQQRKRQLNQSMTSTFTSSSVPHRTTGNLTTDTGATSSSCRRTIINLQDNNASYLNSISKSNESNLNNNNLIVNQSNDDDDDDDNNTNANINSSFQLYNNNNNNNGSNNFNQLKSNKENLYNLTIENNFFSNLNSHPTSIVDENISSSNNNNNNNTNLENSKLLNNVNQNSNNFERKTNNTNNDNAKNKYNLSFIDGTSSSNNSSSNKTIVNNNNSSNDNSSRKNDSLLLSNTKKTTTTTASVPANESKTSGACNSGSLLSSSSSSSGSSSSSCSENSYCDMNINNEHNSEDNIEDIDYDYNDETLSILVDGNKCNNNKNSPNSSSNINNKSINDITSLDLIVSNTNSVSNTNLPIEASITAANSTITHTTTNTTTTRTTTSMTNEPRTLSSSSSSLVAKLVAQKDKPPPPVAANYYSTNKHIKLANEFCSDFDLDSTISSIKSANLNQTQNTNDNNNRILVSQNCQENNNNNNNKMNSGKKITTANTNNNINMYETFRSGSNTNGSSNANANANANNKSSLSQNKNSLGIRKNEQDLLSSSSSSSLAASKKVINYTYNNGSNLNGSSNATKNDDIYTNDNNPTFDEMARNAYVYNFHHQIGSNNNTNNNNNIHNTNRNQQHQLQQQQHTESLIPIRIESTNDNNISSRLNNINNNNINNTTTQQSDYLYSSNVNANSIQVDAQQAQAQLQQQQQQSYQMNSINSTKKKNSNLKKPSTTAYVESVKNMPTTGNSANVNHQMRPGVRQNEKVKFSDVELRHLIAANSNEKINDYEFIETPPSRPDENISYLSAIRPRPYSTPIVPAYYTTQVIPTGAQAPPAPPPAVQAFNYDPTTYRYGEPGGHGHPLVRHVHGSAHSRLPARYSRRMRHSNTINFIDTTRPECNYSSMYMDTDDNVYMPGACPTNDDLIYTNDYDAAAHRNMRNLNSDFNIKYMLNKRSNSDSESDNYVDIEFYKSFYRNQQHLLQQQQQQQLINRRLHKHHKHHHHHHHRQMSPYKANTVMHLPPNPAAPAIIKPTKHPRVPDKFHPTQPMISKSNGSLNELYQYHYPHPHPLHHLINNSRQFIVPGSRMPVEVSPNQYDPHIQDIKLNLSKKYSYPNIAAASVAQPQSMQQPPVVNQKPIVVEQQQQQQQQQPPTMTMTTTNFNSSTENQARQEAEEEEDPTSDMNKLLDSCTNNLMAENTSSFIDSPIHVLMNHHKNQRMLKQKRQEIELREKLLRQKVNLTSTSSSSNAANTLTRSSQIAADQSRQDNGQAEQQLNGAALIGENISVPTVKRNLSTDSLTALKAKLANESQQQQQQQRLSNNDEEENRKLEKEKKLDAMLKSKKFFAFLVTSLLTVASINLLEIFTCLIRQNYSHLMFLKLSSCLITFLFLILLANNNKLNTIRIKKFDNKYRTNKIFYFNLFLMSDFFFENRVQIRENETDNVEADDDDDGIIGANDAPPDDDEEERENLLKLNDNSGNYFNFLAPNSVESMETASAGGSSILSNKNLKPGACFSGGTTGSKMNKKHVLSHRYLMNLVEMIINPKMKSNFYVTLLSLLLIYFWILSTYLIGYLNSSTRSSSFIYTNLFKRQSRENYHHEEKNSIETYLGPLSGLFEIGASVIGGIGASLFFKNVVLIAFETIHRDMKSNKNPNPIDNDAAQTETSCLGTSTAAKNKFLLDLNESQVPNNQKRKLLLINIFKQEHADLIRYYQKKLLKYFIVIQSNLVISAMFIFYIIILVGESPIDRVFNQFCIESIANSTRLQICPALASKTTFFNWKNEILHRKISLQETAKKFDNIEQSDLEIRKYSRHNPQQQPATNSGDNKHMLMLSNDDHHMVATNNQYEASKSSIIRNQTGIIDQNASPSSSSSSKLSPIEDIYLLLICVTLINFFISLIMPLIFVKTTPKNSAKLNKLAVVASIEKKVNVYNQLRLKQPKFPTPDDDDDSGGFFALKNATEIYNKRLSSYDKQMTKLHLLMPLIFFHGYIKTILFNELNKWYASCLTGTKHLTQLLLFFGLSSFLSILCLSILIIICNLKRNVLFLLVFIQQITLIILLFYWDPLKPIDFKSYHIDYIFFICYAICDNLWLAHNLKSLLSKSYELEKSPCVVLMYGYSLFSFGSFVGYATSIYFCFPIKLFLSLIFLLAFSFIYVMSEMVFYLKKKLI